jgi:hypothetical protein
MPKHDDKFHHKGEDATLVGSPAALINLLIKDANLNQWATSKNGVLAEARLIGDGS